MDERGYNSEDDFVHNEVEEADVRITAAIANMGNLRHFIRPAKKSKKNQKPGGHRTSVVRMMFYLLPDGSEIPKFTRRDPIIQTHQNHGFGYPATYYSNFSGKYHPMSVNLTEDEFREEIRSLYQRLGEKEFGLYTIGKDKKLTAAPFKPSYFKENKYQGRVIIKINENPDVQPAPSVDVNETASTEQQQLEPIPSPGQQEIVEIQPRFLESATQTMVSSFREEVTINPRHALILQQDLEYAESLLIDQNKDHQRMQASLRRSMAREERQRQRNLQKERQEKIQAEAIEEISFLRNYGNQDDLLTMIFVLPTGQQNRKISKKTPSETLHIYVEATFNVLSAKLLIGSKVITRTQQTIGDLGITANSRVIVEDLAIESEDSASEEDQDDIAIDDTLPYNPTHLNDITELNKRRVNIYEHLLPAKSITIRRTHLVQDVLDTYRLDKSLVHHHLQVTFEGEEKALDLEGVTREMFSTVIPQLMANYFTGRQEKVPSNEISFLFDGTFEVIGQILAHAFVLVNYLATGLSSVILGLIGTGDCSNALLLSSFKKFVSEEESRLIEDALKLKAFDQNMLFQLINFFGSYQGTEVPKPSTLHHQLISLAKLQLCVIPLYAISKLKEGLSCYPILFKGITEDVIKELKEQYQPTGQKIIDQLYFVFTEDDIVLRSMEERVKGYLERFISNLSNTELSEMLRFWTSADTVCLDKLTVMFNSLEGLQRRPLANTCTATLQVSRLYLSATELSKEFKTFIMDPSSRVFDSI